MRAIIVEDEKTGLDNLMIKIAANCPGIDIVATCRSGEAAIQEIASLQPDLVFLDINLGSMSGFDVLDRLQHIDFEVIFTTAYDNFAIRAIKTSALDYLLKPIDEDELKTAVLKAWEVLGKQRVSRQIAVPIEHSIRMLQCDDIICCDADDNNTLVYLTGVAAPLKIPRSLNDLYLKLPRQQFFRIHRSHVANRYFIEQYKEGFVYLKQVKTRSVSRSNKDEFLSWLGA